MTDQFQHVMVLASIIIGLGITYILVGVIAVILNIPTALWGLQYWFAIAQSPLRTWDYKVALLICFSLAPVFALIAMMGNSEPRAK